MSLLFLKKWFFFLLGHGSVSIAVCREENCCIFGNIFISSEIFHVIAMKVI